MKRLTLGAAAAGSAVFALHHLAPRVRAMHAHCREMMTAAASRTATVT